MLKRFTLFMLIFTLAAILAHKLGEMVADSIYSFEMFIEQVELHHCGIEHEEVYPCTKTQP